MSLSRKIIVVVAYLFVLTLLGFLFTRASQPRPVVYKSTSTGEIVRIEYEGEELSMEEFDRLGMTAEDLIWVK